MEPVQDVRRVRIQQHDAEQDLTAVNVPNPPEVPNDVESAEVETTIVEMCEKCCRTTTDEYKLDFHSMKRNSLNTTKFGKHVAQMGGEVIRMCNQCVNYTNNVKRHLDWPNAWPSVMYTLLFDTHRFNSNAENFLCYYMKLRNLLNKI